jgi:beta-aspartyl-peptidase (threonine type)
MLMHVRSTIAVSVFLLGAAGTALAHDAPGAKTVATSTSGVRAVLDKQVEAWNRGDLDGFMAGYWNSPDLVFQSGATLTRGWQQTRERYRRLYQAEGKEMGRLRFEELDVQPLSPDAAFVRGRWQLTMKDGSQPGGLFTLLLRRVGGEWKIVHDHTS